MEVKEQGLCNLIAQAISMSVVTARVYWRHFWWGHWLHVSHVSISTNIPHKSVLDTIIHLPDEDSEAQNMHEDSQKQN